jgi:hypothetical protein
MKISKFEKSVCIWCPWFFGAVFIVVALFGYKGGDPLVKVLITGFGLLYMSLYCIAFLISKLVESASERKEQSVGKND